MLYLRRYVAEDALAVAGWVRDEREFRMWSADRYGDWPVTAGDINANYEACASGGGFWPLTADDGEGPAGHLIIRVPGTDRGILRLGFVILDPAKRGRGLGTELVRLASEYAFGTLGARKVTLGVFENNGPAKRCYLAAGFRETDSGEPEFYSVMGERWRCLEMERVRPERCGTGSEGRV